MSVEGCGGWTTLASSDSVGHAYLFDILRSEMRFFPGELRISHSLSLSLRFPIFSFSPLSPLSLLPLVYEVGNELWQLAARKNTATAIHANLSPTFEGRKKFSLAVIGLGLGPTAIALPSSTFKRRLIGRSFSPSSSSSSFPFLLFFKVIEFPFFPLPSQTQSRVVC